MSSPSSPDDSQPLSALNLLDSSSAAGTPDALNSSQRSASTTSTKGGGKKKEKENQNQNLFAFPQDLERMETASGEGPKSKPKSKKGSQSQVAADERTPLQESPGMHFLKYGKNKEGYCDYVRHAGRRRRDRSDRHRAGDR